MELRIILTGAQGTGKTSVLNHFKSCLKPITEVARKLHSQGIKINEEGDDNTQRLIFNEYLQKLSEKTDYISDRGLSDVIAYTMYLVNSGNIKDEKLLNEQLSIFEKFMKDNPDIIVVYFPIEFSLKDDGVRSMNEDFRKSIDENILKLIKQYCPNFLTVSGTIEERINQIISYADDVLIDKYVYNNKKDLNQ